MRASRALAVGILLAGCMPAKTAIPPTSASALPASCPADSHWTAPKLLRAKDGGLWVISRLAGAPVRGGTLLIGAQVAKWDVAAPAHSTGTLRREPWAGVILGADGMATPVSLPPNTTMQWIAPLPIAAEDSSVDVVWGTHPDSANLSSFIATSLWYARFNGRQWSNPQQIARADGIWWDGSTNDATRVDGSLHLATRAFDNTHDPSPWTGALHLRLSKGRWSVTPIHPPDFFPRYTAILARDARDVRIFYTGRVREGSSVELNGLAVIESHDGGSTWEAPRIIRHLDGRTGYWLRAQQYGDEYSLTWATLPEPGAVSSGVSRLTSSDGERWTGIPDLVLSNQLLGFANVPQPVGNRVILQTIDDVLYSAELSMNAWRSPTRIAADAVTMPAVTVINGGRVLLAWDATQSTDSPNGSTKFVAVLTSELRDCAAWRALRRSPQP